MQESQGQHNNLANNNPTFEQNNLSQSFQNAGNVKSVNENVGTKANACTQKQVSSQQSSIPQSSFQQLQNFPHLINPQPPQTSDSVQPVLYKPQLSVMQPPITTKQPYSTLESLTAFVPTNNVGKINVKYQQQATPSIQKIPLQIAQSVPISKAYLPTYTSISSIPSSEGQRIDYGNQYFFPISAYPYPYPDQIVNSLPTYGTTLTTPNLPTVENNVIVPYKNFDVINNPLDNISQTATGEDECDENDKLTKLLISLFEPPKKSSKYLQSDNQGNSYTIYKMDQDSNPISLKSLLPVIVNLIKERREGCGCCSNCQCYRKSRNKKKPTSEKNKRLGTEKRDYMLKEEMFCNEESEEDVPRFTREHKKEKNIKSHTSNVSAEDNENDSMDYDHSSEQQDD